jgi:hypothetical protein
MSGLLNFGSRAQKPNKLGSIQVQTSEFGVAVPIVLGTNRIGLKIIDYVDFVAKPAPETGSGKGGGGSSSYEYYAAVLMLACEGPCDGVGDIFAESGAAQLLKATESFTISSSRRTYQVVNGGTAFFYDEGVSYAGTYTIQANDYGSDGLTQINGQDVLPMQKVSGAPSSLQYQVNATGLYTFSAADAGKVVSIAYAYTATPTHTSSGETAEQNTPAQYLRLTVFDGTRPQSPWGYMLSNHSTHALPYQGKVLVASPNLDLGQSATLPSFNIEILNGQGLAFGGGVNDCDPAACLTAICTNIYWGAGWPHLGDLTQFSNYCVAMGIFMSPIFDTATQTSQVMSDIISLCNSESFYSWDGLLKIVPYGDTTTHGFGRTYVPNTQPLFDLSNDDFMVAEGEEPVRIDVPDLADNYNYFKLEFLNRANSYNVELIDDVNQASVDVIGLRAASTITAHQICSAQAAQIALNGIVRRASYPFNTYKFKLNQCFPNLEPMDIVTLTRPALGMQRYPVRIKSAEEDSTTCEMSFTAEDFPWGVGQPAVYSRDTGGGVGPAGMAFPGSVYPPVIFEASSRISKSGNSEIWMGLAGLDSGNWGGCDVYVSTDNVNYKKVGRQEGPARVGILNSYLPVTSDPLVSAAFVPVGGTPTGTNLIVEIYPGVNTATLISGTQADADSLKTLCWIDGEYFAYSLITPYQYGVSPQIGGSRGGFFGGGGLQSSSTQFFYLANYVRRGQLGSPITAHNVRVGFLRLDDAVFVFEPDTSIIGQQLYFKFLSFNVLYQMQQNLADVVAYTFQYNGTSLNPFTSVLNTVQLTSTASAGAASIVVATAPGFAAASYVANGITYSLPPTTIPGLSFSTYYAVNFNPFAQTYVTYTDQAVAAADLQLGFISIGSLTTCASSGTGGSPGGAPGGGGGGYGGGVGGREA